MARHLLRGVVVLLSSVIPAVAADPAPWRIEVTSTTLSLAMVDCETGNDSLSIAQKEASRIWSRADVTLRWVEGSQLPYMSSRSEWVVVRCATGAEPAPSDADRVLAIAAIRFLNAKPTNTIMVSLRNATTLLEREAPESRDHRGRFVAFRETKLGRMLGRAVAHEIGHFLSQSGNHTSSGLMRASHTVAALTGTSLSAFKVDDAARGLLRARRLPIDPVFEMPCQY
jgi:hypothetical protein